MLLVLVINSTVPMQDLAEWFFPLMSWFHWRYVPVLVSWSINFSVLFLLHNVSLDLLYIILFYKILMNHLLLWSTIRQQLTNTEDIRRMRKKAPCTCTEILMIQRQFLEEGIFSEPVLTGELILLELKFAFLLYCYYIYHIFVIYLVYISWSLNVNFLLQLFLVSRGWENYSFMGLGVCDCWVIFNMLQASK